MTWQDQFKDVTPVDINTEQPQLCQILYDDEYKYVMGLLMALIQQKEYSERALLLTQKGIELLASHYTIWNYRFNIITNLDKDLYDELDWCEQLALENEKNYQIWNYRQLIIETILSRTNNKDANTKKFNPYHEYPILAAMLEEDSKNHHVWSYRKWLVEKFNLYQDEREITFVDDCLNSDLRNNSAWTHRFFIKFHNIDKLNPHDKDIIINKELQYVKNCIEKSPQNPSSWNYLQGIYKKFQFDIAELHSFCLQFANLSIFSENNHSKENIDDKSELSEIISSSYALELLAQIFIKDKNFANANLIYDLLAEKYDPIRKNYWMYLKVK